MVFKERKGDVHDNDKIKLEDIIKSNKNLEKIKVLDRNEENLYIFNDEKAKY